MCCEFYSIAKDWCCSLSVSAVLKNALYFAFLRNFCLSTYTVINSLGHRSSVTCPSRPRGRDTGPRTHRAAGTEIEPRDANIDARLDGARTQTTAGAPRRAVCLAGHRFSWRSRTYLFRLLELRWRCKYECGIRKPLYVNLLWNTCPYSKIIWM